MAKNDAIMDCSTIILRRGDDSIDSCVDNMIISLDHLVSGRAQLIALELIVASFLLNKCEGEDLPEQFMKNIRGYMDSYLEFYKETH